MASPLPTRLFKLNSLVVRHADDSFDLANNPLGTIITGGAPPVLESCNYCAISHVWGRDPPQFPCAGIPWKVPISSKEKLLFMLKACERRGYEYVWIDLLCINQADREDGNAEVPKMQQYYKNAHATIVFGSNWRDFASNWARVEARITDWNGDWGRGLNVHWDGIADIDRFIKDDWFWRVWTLQETVVPLTTNPLAPVVKGEAPYNRSRLLTSDGIPIDIRGLCSLIEWTYVALGRLDYTTVVGTYSWIHPGAGIANDHEWWKMTILNDAIGLGAAPLHPVRAMRLTRYRNTGQPVDRLRGVYALIDPDWQLEALTADTKDFPASQLADKYIAKREGALLLTMAVNPGKKTRTWAAGAFPESEFGSAVPAGGKYPLMGTPSVDDQGALSFEAAGLASNVTVWKDKTYGDGSGELATLLTDLYELQKSSVNITAIITLITLAVDRSRIDAKLNSLDDITSFFNEGVSNANAISSALRAEFAGWYRWIFVMDDNTAVLAWVPPNLNAAGPRVSAYSLLWLTHGTNEWAVVVEGDPKAGCTKVGIAFVNSTEPVESQTGVVIL